MPHRRTNGPVLPLNKARADMLRRGFPANHSRQTTNALCRAVPYFFLGIVAVQLDQHCVINFGTKCAFYCRQRFHSK